MNGKQVLSAEDDESDGESSAATSIEGDVCDSLDKILEGCDLEGDS